MPSLVEIAIVQQLRMATRALHSRIETNPWHSALVAGRATVELYTGLLERMFAFHSAFEISALGHPDWASYGIDWRLRSKRPALERDLQFLGIAPSSIAPACLPLGSASLPHLAGYLYVLEGSTLGGQILLRLIHSQLGFGAAGGATYFASYGSEVGTMWRACLTSLEAIAAAGPDAAGKIVAGAIEAFEQLQLLLDQPPDVTKLAASLKIQ